MPTTALGFAPSSVLPSAPAVRRSVCGDLHMGKGKGTNISMRGEMKKRAEMQRMREQMFGDDSDGFPVFTVYVRSKKGQVWYPGGSLKGDDRSKALVESWRDNTLMLKDQYKGSLDGGMAKSIFDDKQKFVQSLVKMYPQLKNSKDELEFGYTVKVPGLQEKMEAEGRKDELKITLLKEEMTQSLFDKMNPFK
jgi:hypothetical protein